MTSFAVIGGFGFVGSHLVDHLCQHYPDSNISVIDDLRIGRVQNLSPSVVNHVHFEHFDASDYNRLSLFLLRRKFDYVINLTVLPLVFSIKEPVHGFNDIIKTQQSILECARNGYFDKLIYFSTSEVYGGMSADSILTEESPLLPKTTYAAAKAAADLLTHSYKECYNVRCVILRLFNQYGPKKTTLEMGGIIPSAISSLSKGNSVMIYNQHATRDFVYVDDTIDAIQRTIDRFEAISGSVINISSGVQRSIVEIVNEIGLLMQISPSLDFSKSRSGDVDHLVGNNSRAAELLDWKPKMKWQVGLERCIDYYSRVENRK